MTTVLTPGQLRWRCTRRGLLELDITLGRFLDSAYAQLDPADQAAFAELISLEDAELWALINGTEQCAAERCRPALEALRDSAGVGGATRNVVPLQSAAFA